MGIPIFICAQDTLPSIFNAVLSILYSSVYFKTLIADKTAATSSEIAVAQAAPITPHLKAYK